MINKKPWKTSDETLLIAKYSECTIGELMELFKDRSADSINAKIKNLRKKGKINDYKDKDTVERSLKQR